MTEENHQAAISDELLLLLRRLAVGTGILLIVAALLADVIGISAKGISGGQRLIILLGGVLVGAGLLGKRLPSVYRTLGILLLNTVVMLICIEIAAGFISKIISTDDDGANTETVRLQGFDHPQYANYDWAETYWSEMNQFQIKYAPYLVWDHVPFDGETLTITADGNRETPGADCEDADAYRVFMFGGSTMWGYGALNEGTIPAFVQSALSGEMEQAVCVVNFGRTAYVSTQELLQLIFELRAGNIPDVVIFYDGINDVYAAYQSGKTTHQNQPQIIDRLYSETTEEPFSEVLRQELIDNTYTVNLLNRWFSTEESEKSPSELITYKTMGIDTQTLAEEIDAVYIGNYELARTLGESYGFEAYFFWQPALILKSDQLTDNEQHFLADLDPARVELYRAADAILQEQITEYDHIYDISDIFGNKDFWIDDMHIVPEGNQVIANAMLSVIRPPE